MSLLASEPVDLLKAILGQVRIVLADPLKAPSHQMVAALKNLLTQAMFNFRLLWEQNRLPLEAQRYRLSLWVRPLRPEHASRESLSAQDYDFTDCTRRKGAKRLLANQFVHMHYFALRINGEAKDLHLLVTSRKEAQFLFEAPVSEVVDLLELATCGGIGDSKPVDILERVTAP